MIPRKAYYYAYHGVKGKFPEGENAIASNAEYSLMYAMSILHDRFPKGEKEIMKVPRYSVPYAIDILKRRWPEAEPYLERGQHWYRDTYNKHFNADLKDRSKEQ